MDADPTSSRCFVNRTPAVFPTDFDAEAVATFHRRLPGYAPTPLVELPEVAARLGVGRLWVKDESARLGLPAYKVLGASWATYRALEQRLGPFAPWADLADLARQLRSRPAVELVAATEGNHGRAVARMARWLGLRAHILLPGTAAAPRVDAIRREGARITIVDGVYDDAVRVAAALHGGAQLVISDTAWDGYTDIPRWVIDGYDTLFREADAQLADLGTPPPDAVAVQMGVGALATAVVKHYRRPGRPAHVIGVEPTLAACIFESIAAGRIVEIPGPYDPAMAGLNCGTPSPVGWPFVSRGLSACVALPTRHAEDAMSALAAAGVHTSPSGAAGLGGFLALFGDAAGAPDRQDFAWNERTTLLAVATEAGSAPRESSGV